MHFPILAGNAAIAFQYHSGIVIEPGGTALEQ